MSVGAIDGQGTSAYLASGGGQATVGFAAEDSQARSWEQLVAAVLGHSD